MGVGVSGVFMGVDVGVGVGVGVDVCRLVSNAFINHVQEYTNLICKALLNSTFQFRVHKCIHM